MKVAGTNADHINGINGGTPVGIYPGINKTGIPFPIVVFSVSKIGYNGLVIFGTHQKT